MQPSPFTCSRCNAPLPPGVIQCPNCGLAFDAPVPGGPMSPYAQVPGAQMPPYGVPGGPMPQYAPAPPQKSGSGAAIIIAVVLGVSFFFVLILAAILFPVFAKARDKAREISSMSNLKQLGLATMQYSQDYDEKLPPMDTFSNYKAAVSSYVPNQPNNVDPFIETGANVPYVVNPDMSEKSFAEIADPRSTVLLKEAVPHSDGRINVLYADGHVISVSADGDQ